MNQHTIKQIAVISGMICAMSTSLFAQTEKKTIAVVTFKNRTTATSTRVAPGTYKEKNIKVGKDTSTEVTDEVKGGKRIQKKTTHEQDIRKKELERVIEYAPGAWSLPDEAGGIVADAICSNLIETHLFNVLDRSTFGLKTIEMEKLYQSTNGSGTGGVISMLKEKGADWMVLGTINQYRVDETKATAYGMNISKVVTRITLNVRVVDVNDGSIVFSKDTQGGVSMRIPEGVTSITSIYDWEKSLKMAVADATGKLSKHFQKLNSKGTSSQNLEKKISVHFESNPTGADVLVDGVFIGNTPTEMELKPTECKIILKLQGYKPWGVTMVPRSGMKIKPSLESLNPTTPPLGKKQDKLKLKD